MPTYEYECTACGLRFERRQALTDAPRAECPECNGKARRLVSGGTGFIMKGSGHGSSRGSEACSMEQGGKTCCGRDERCDKPPCRD